MIYSQESFDKYQKQKLKEKRKTWLVVGISVAVIVFLIAVIFAFDLPYLGLIGFAVSVFAFSYAYSRKTLVHKKLAEFCDFYYDVLYGDRTTSEVVFLGESGKSVNGGRAFNYVLVFDLKTQSKIKLYFDEDYQIDMVKDKKYLATKTENMLIDYSLLGGDDNAI